jgi:hypothetical protein
MLIYVFYERRRDGNTEMSIWSKCSPQKPGVFGMTASGYVSLREEMQITQSALLSQAPFKAAIVAGK